MKRIFTILILLILCSFTHAQSNQQIEKVLDKMGAIKPHSSGSYNTTGYTMSYGKNNKPLFNKITSPQNANTYTWGSLGPDSSNNGVNDKVMAIAISGNDIYVGGYFTSLGDSTSANHIAKWNSSTKKWSVLPSGSSNGVNNYVNTIAISGSDVYVGGDFTQLGDSTSANYIAKWNTTTSTWSTLTSGASNGVNNSVYALAISGSDVYVGGDFNKLGDSITSANNIAQWNSLTNYWSFLPSGSSNGVNNSVFSIAISDSDVYIGGSFTFLGDSTTSANYIIKWNSSNHTWSTLPIGSSNGIGGVGNVVSSIAINSNDVYIGGLFNYLGDGVTVANNIVKWNNAKGSWTALTDSTNNGVWSAVRTITGYGKCIYVGGNVLSFPPDSNNTLAKWDVAANSWSAIGNGNTKPIRAIQFSQKDNKIYLGGDFTILNKTTSAHYIGTFSDSDNPSSHSLPQIIYYSLSPDTIWAGAKVVFSAVVCDSAARNQYAEAFIDSQGTSFSGIYIPVADTGKDSTHYSFYYEPDLKDLREGAHQFFFHQLDSAGNWSKFVSCNFTLFKEKSNNWSFYGQNQLHNSFNKFDSTKVPMRLKWQRQVLSINPGSLSVINNRIFYAENVIMQKCNLHAVDLDDGNEIYNVGFGSINAVGLPSFSQGRLLLQSNNNSNGSYILSLNYFTGNTIWKKAVRPQWDNNWQPLFYKNVVIAYVAGSLSGLSAFDRTTGNLLWTKAEQVPYNSSPALIDSTLYCYNQDTLKAINVFTGVRRWTATGMPYSFDNLIDKIPVADTLLNKIFLSDDHHLVCFDLATKTIKWSVSGNFIYPPAQYNGRLYDIDSTTLKVYDEITGALLYRFVINRNINHASVISNGIIYISTDTHVYALDIKTMEVKWDYLTGGNLVAANNYLIISEKHGYISVFQYDPTIGINEKKRDNYSFQLEQNYPNPFNPSTSISFSVPEKTHVYLRVFNILGKQVKVLKDEVMEKGRYEIMWNAAGLSSGIYIYTLQVNNKIISKKLTLLK
jgi:hypothetical protein